MGTMRPGVTRRWLGMTISALLIGGCATPKTTSENDCDRLMASDGFAEFQRLAVRERVLGQKVLMDHRVCSSDPAALAAFEKGVLFRGLHSERTVEGGNCVKVDAESDPNAESAKAAAQRICEQARLAGARYESWSSLLGGNNILFVSGRSVAVRVIPTRATR